MPDDAELTGQVRQLMAGTFGIDEDELPENVSQATFSRWSSLDHMTLLAALEEQFGTSFSMAEMTRMTSLPAIVAVLRQRR